MVAEPETIHNGASEYGGKSLKVNRRQQQGRIGNFAWRRLGVMSWTAISRIAELKLTRFDPLRDFDTDAGRALLVEQYRSLRDKLPLMYLVMLVNSAALSLANTALRPLPKRTFNAPLAM